MLRRIIRPARRIPLWVYLTIFAPFIIEAFLHSYIYKVQPPERELDAPFYSRCQEPDTTAARENAVLVMLVRNSEIDAANTTVASLERQFNRWFNYPYVFLNDSPFTDAFMAELNRTTGGKATFEMIPQDHWTFPEWIDSDKAQKSIKDQGMKGHPHAGSEGYHHMCRFYSGKFYELEVLKKYKWYWRLEPDVEFMCKITYDPFVQMARHNKVYGYTIALWEVGNTCPNLFRAVANWKEVHDIPTNNLWKAMMSASWVPFPFRRYLGWLPHRDRFGDIWSLCHYWSNFEIADLDLFRSRDYQDFFKYLDKKGGFYYERWGDAAVHSLYVAMRVDPRRVHHFEDFGYRHDLLFQCPANAPGGQLPDSRLLGLANETEWWPEIEDGVGCRCECDGSKPRNHPGYCLNKLKQPNSLRRPWLTWLL